MKVKAMKKIIFLFVSGLALASLSAFGQPVAPRPLPPPVAVIPAIQLGEDQPPPKFDLDFGGGPPRDLVRAIEKSLGKPLNAIVPEEFAATQLPALKMKAVTVPQLFAALEAAGRKTLPYGTYGPGGLAYQQFVTSYGFRTQGPQKEDAIWYFFQEKPSPAPSMKICRFWQLGPYLGGLTIDDITTAIKTGWGMLGETAAPTMNFHKDTKLLIAVGEPDKLALIDSVLKELNKEKVIVNVAPPGDVVPAGEALAVVHVKELRRNMVSVIGQVNKPTLVELPSEQSMTIIEAVAAANGFAKSAKDIEVTRPGEEKVYKFKRTDLLKNVDPDKAFKLKPGDIINVTETYF
jgi:hypothetical protein